MLLYDQDLLTVLDDVSMEPPSSASDIPRLVYCADGRIGVQFDSNDLHRLVTPAKWLSDGCINGCASLLHAMFDSEGGWAVFSTHLISLIQCQVTNDAIWRNVRRNKFWKRRNWIIPIHRRDGSHWVLVLVDISQRVILLFDSFAGSQIDRKSVV